MTVQPLADDVLPKRGARTRLLPLGLILLLAPLVYAPTVGAYFCGYDDFLEARRASDDRSLAVEYSHSFEVSFD